MRRFKFSAFVFCVIAVAGCTKPAKGPTSASATFDVYDIDGGGVQNVGKDKEWEIPESVTYIFSACVKGVTAGEPANTQNFTVEVPGKNKGYPVTTNPKGCFTWDEPMDYNYFAEKSGWVTVERDVVGTGAYQGKQRIRFAVNPWSWGSGKRDSGVVLSLMNGERKLPKGADLVPIEKADDFLAGKLQGVTRLHAANASVNAIVEGEGKDDDGDYVMLRVIVELEPEVKDHDAEGFSSYQKLKDGVFDLYIQIMGANMGPGLNRKVQLLSGDTHAEAVVRKGKVHAEFLVKQAVRPNQSNLELALKMAPKNANAYKTLKPYEALFRLGPGTSIKDHKGTLSAACEVKPEDCEFAKLVGESVDVKRLAGDDPLKKYVSPNTRYFFSNLKLRFIQILPGETTTRRTVLYEATTCINDNGGRPLANTPLVIHYLKNPNSTDYDAEKEYVARTTDEQGCLYWNGRAFHKYYEPEKYFEKNVEIIKGLTPQLAEDGEEVLGVSGTPTFKHELKFYLNPWDDKFTFGWDAREYSKKYFDDLNDMKKHPKIRSRFFLSDYNYRTVRFLYNIDEFMELDVKKRVLMGIVPQVLRYSGIINARKMVEHLRDGIYLMKVAIQKNYLDPRDNSGWLLQNTPELQANIERINGAELAQKEFITTNTVLVRVVDGVIIYPVEFTMRDLRLMRVRSNMMIQLEMVDERLIQAYHEFTKWGLNKEALAKKLEDFRTKLPPNETLDQLNKNLQSQDLDPALKQALEQRRALATSKDVTEARAELDKSVDRIQAGVKLLLEELKRNYEAGKEGLLEHIDSEGKPTGQYVTVPKDSIVLDNLQLSKEEAERLNADVNQVLGINDFSTVELPKKEDIDLNIFAEKDSGLEKRSFVGPVIFLSNAYSDSMRATDNLDEANCEPRDKNGSGVYRSTLQELEMHDHYKQVNQKVEEDLRGKRQNNAFEFDKYFGSLHHLCYKSVDDMIKKEKWLRLQAFARSQASALKYNFVQNFNLDFISLTNEPMQKMREGCAEAILKLKKVGDSEEAEDLDENEVKKQLRSCLEITAESTVDASEVPALVNERLPYAVNLHNTNLRNRGNGPWRVSKQSWAPSEYQELFFNHSLEGKNALCNMVATRMSKEVTAQNLSRYPVDMLYKKIFDVCSESGGLIHDIKHRVDKTGRYAFLGGLNLNFNVGEGFSVGTSNGWSAGMEITDIVGVGGTVGGGLLKGAALAVKPANLKFGTGLSSSEGTSVSESTYLVSQIAGFDVELSAYERCAWVGLSPKAIGRVQSWADNGFNRALGISGADFSNQAVAKAFHRGLFVCEGTTRAQNQPITVPETYFYFTQHFTEGDMLDQADLYNHPWLLSLRGMRDFATFVEKIRAQEKVNLWGFLSHLTGSNEERPKGWALEQLFEAYAVNPGTPTFPGFYTVLDPNEPRIHQFALQQAANRQRGLSKVDEDPNQEVIHPKVYSRQAPEPKPTAQPPGPIR